MAEMTTVTHTPHNVEFEEFMASMREIDESMRKFDEGMQKLKEKDEEAARRQEELDRKFKETDRFLKRVGRQIGGLNRRFGQLAEHLVAPNIHKRFNERGFHIRARADRGCTIYTKDGSKVRAEIDLMLEDSEYMIAVEVKATSTLADIEHHIKRLEILREERDGAGDKRKILGAIAGAMFNEKVKEAIIEAGMFVIEQTGDTMRIDVPGDFVPKEW
jgi:hypothetical protein